jgi:ketosteroid isomerase-like protein
MKQILVVALVSIAGAHCGGADSKDAGRSQSSLDEASSAHDSHFQRHRLQREILLAFDRLHSDLTDRWGIVDGFVSLLSQDVLYLHVGASIIQGRNETRDFLAMVFANPSSFRLRWTTMAGDVSQDGRLGYTVGWTELTVIASDGRTTVQHGKYVSFWRLSHGIWRVVAYVRNPSPGPPPPPPDGFPLLAGDHGTPHPGDVERARAELLQNDAQFSQLSVEQGRAVAFPAYVAQDGVQLPGGGQMVFGKEAITQFFSTAPIEQVLSWTPMFVDVARSGDLGFTVGNAVLRVPRPDGTFDNFYSKYLTVWARQSDESWKYILDAGNASPPPAN